MDRRRVLLLLMVGVIGLLLVTRCAQPDDQGSPDPPTGNPGATLDPHTGVDHGVVDPDPPASSADTGPAQPAAVAAAEEFARAWVHTDEQWSTRLAELATADVLESLSGVDPATVPATAVTGPGNMVSEVPGWASVAVPTDVGTVVLHVIAVDDAWLVSAIDWRPEW